MRVQEKHYLSKKLKTLFETQNDAKSCTVFEQLNPKKSLQRLNLGFRKINRKLLIKRKWYYWSYQI